MSDAQFYRDRMAAEAFMAGKDQPTKREEEADLRRGLEPIAYCSCCNRVIEEGYCPVCDVQSGLDA